MVAESRGRDHPPRRSGPRTRRKDSRGRACWTPGPASTALVPAASTYRGRWYHLHWRSRKGVWRPGILVVVSRGRWTRGLTVKRVLALVVALMLVLSAGAGAELLRVGDI